MDTRVVTPQARKAGYCRIGIIFLDETGHISALSQNLPDVAGALLREGDSMPAELLQLGPGEGLFWGDDWFIQAEGKERVEVFLFRRVRTADQALGAYGESTINEEMVRMILSNPYEGLTAVDTEGRVTFLSPANEKWLGLEVGAGLGIPLSDFAPGSRLAETARTGVADSAQVVDLQGKTKITINLPIKRDNKVIGAVGRILFQSTDQVEKLAGRVRAMELQVERYETLLDEMRGERYSFESIMTRDPEMRTIIEQARRISDSTASVLMLGESGTGKELFAQALHETSRRKKNPFVAINCGAIPRDLIESELFGYEEGAFSGAKKRGKPGKFELANGGTLFLDEVGELPLESQAKLLRVLEERKVDRLGGTSTIPVDFRLIAATNCDMDTLVAAGKFRKDLYYRINDYPLEIPPLRSRPKDIPHLAKHFLAEVCRKERLPILKLSEEALSVLSRHDWPGNVRELRGLMRQLAWKASGPVIEAHHLPLSINKGHSVPFSGKLDEQLARVERSAIEAALLSSDGNRAGAARLLGIHRTALYKKMAALGIPVTR